VTSQDVEGFSGSFEQYLHYVDAKDLMEVRKQGQTHVHTDNSRALTRPVHMVLWEHIQQPAKLQFSGNEPVSGLVAQFTSIVAAAGSRLVVIMLMDSVIG
jgi:hypothetical protein